MKRGGRMESRRENNFFIEKKIYYIGILTTLLLILLIPKTAYASSIYNSLGEILSEKYLVDQDVIVVYRNNNVFDDSKCNLEYDMKIETSVIIGNGTYYIDDGKVDDYKALYVPKKAENQEIKISPVLVGKNNTPKNYFAASSTQLYDERMYYLCGKSEKKKHKHYYNDVYDCFIFPGSIVIENKELENDRLFPMLFEDMEVEVGDSFNCSIEYDDKPLYATSSDHDFIFEWASSNDKVATITKDGAVTVNSKGKCKIQLKINGYVSYEQTLIAKDNNGWKTENDKKYYYKDGVAVTGLYKIKGVVYVFNTDGSLVLDKIVKIDGKKYYSDDNGELAVNEEVTVKDVTYIADKNGVLTKKTSNSDKVFESDNKTTEKVPTETVTFKKITMEIPSTWVCDTNKSNYIYYKVGGAAFELYTVTKSGSLTQEKADRLIKKIGKDYDYLTVKKTKAYEYKNKKITDFYLYNVDLGVKNYHYVYTGRMTVDSSGRISTYEKKAYTLDCKSRFTLFEYDGVCYVASMTFEATDCKNNSFDEYTDVIKSIKPASKTSGTSTKKSTSNNENVGGGSSTSNTTVYITATGKSYHYKNPCGNGTYTAVSLSWAIANGYTPCGKCAK
ncbi:MAG: Ig-like domain-containing protein [Lachnospiraceae bacterium]|nr:Ig-like domain-containing protein [Lachnospiraceae bacterium]